MNSLPELLETPSRRSWLKRLSGLVAGSALLSRAQPAAAHADRHVASPLGLDPFLGEIMMVAFPFAPRGWALCNGQQLPINQYQALFSLLGVQYGGNGTTTFALPDLRGRVPVAPGSGPGLTPRAMGTFGGSESQGLTEAEMPAHTHPLPVSLDLGTTTLAGSTAAFERNYLANSGSGSAQYAAVANATLAPAAVGNTGSGQPHENRQPFLAINFVIALNGVFPSRQ